ncbi:A24 family peptidase [Paenibacillus harenae]|uniref:A24 family peptidase n=1 Tax=Paenibacillus harenae TaxID=306543 RepID=UPI000417BDDF|nr:A24 family peptidase [Paenibacillus harenae]
MEPIQTAATALLLIFSFITDIRTQLIPNRLTASFFAAAFLYHFAVEGWDGLMTAAAGAAAGFIPLLLLHFAKGIGAGDVKLFGAIGAWTGAWVVLQLMLYSILYAGLIGICILIAIRPLGKRFAAELSTFAVPESGWKKRQWMQWARSGKKFPFMLAVVPAAVTVWLMAN